MAEARSAADAEDSLAACAFLFGELLGKTGTKDEIVRQFTKVLITDSKNTYDNLLKNGAYLGMKEKMAGLDLKVLKQVCYQRGTSIRWVHGDAMLANTLTKSGKDHQMNMYYEKGHRYRITYDPSFLSARKRKAAGIKMLSDDRDLEQLNQSFEEFFNDVPEHCVTACGQSSSARGFPSV